MVFLGLFPTEADKLYFRILQGLTMFILVEI